MLSVAATLALAGSARAVSVTAVRYDSKTEHTRFVAEFDAAFRYQNFNTLSDRDYFYVDIPSTTGGAKDRTIKFSDGLIDHVECVYHKNQRTQRFVFHLKRKSPYTVETMSKPDRLVIDVLRNGLVQTAPDRGIVAQASTGNQAIVRVAPTPAARKWRVIIDPGHGGKSIGADSRKIGGRVVKEKDVVLKVGLELAKLIQRSPTMTCSLTRQSDRYVSLSDRVTFAGANKGDVFVSIHCNAAPNYSQRSARGVEFYYLDVKRGETTTSNRVLLALENDENVPGVAKPHSNPQLRRILDNLTDDRLEEVTAESQRLCEAMDRRFRTSPQLTYRKYNRGVKTMNLHVLRQTEMPGMLLEIGFLSNDTEAQLLNRSDFQVYTAKLIYDSLNDFFARRTPRASAVKVASK